jgi:SAM-dependent methyltransferase
MTPEPQLTTIKYWERLWAGTDRTASGGRLRRRLRLTTTWYRLLERLLDSARCDGPARVLELGCAPGTMLRTLHRLRPDHSYAGIDNAPDSLIAARDLLAAAGIDAPLHLGDIRDTHLPPVDLVMSFGLIEHFVDPAEAMRYHRRFLQPGGVAAVTVPNYAHPAVVPVLRRFSPATLDTHNLAVMSPAALGSALTAAGFTDVRTGESGTALLPCSRVRPDFGGTCYRQVARVWNVGTSVLPEGVPWAATIWATGVNPE